MQEGLSDRVKQICGDAKKELEKLDDKFDFIFLDGPKGQYIYYLPLIEKLLDVDGTIFADNVLFRGKVLSDEWPEHKHRTIILNLRKYLDVVSKPPYKSEIVDIEDGVCITKKINN